MQNFIGYNFLAFENGIGNILNPTVEWWTGQNKLTATIIIGIVYLTWFLNQLVLLVFLLNFVIGIISEQYSNVMDSQVMYTCQQRCELNDECDRILKFFRTFKIYEFKE